MSTVIRKELKIFRGTIDEVKAVTTEDMTIYLAWDTGELFVGNALGAKTPYTGKNNLSERQVIELIESTIEEVLGEDITLINGQLTTINTSNNQLTVRVGNIETAIDSLEASLDSTIESKLEEIAGSGILSDYYTKSETDARVVAKVEEFTYSKNEIETRIPDVSSFATTSALNSQISEITKFNSVENLVTPSPLVDLAGLLSKPDGAYLINTAEYGREILLISTVSGIKKYTRIAGDGHSYSLVGGVWVSIDDKDKIYISTVNNLSPDNGNLNITLDSIPDTTNRIINNLLPQSLSSFYTDAINPLGRNSTKSVGDESIAFGKNSAAEGESAVAIGSGAFADADNSIQLGSGTNITEGTFKVLDFTLLEDNGKIPNERLKDRYVTLTLLLTQGNWTNGELKTINVEATGVTPDSIIWINPTEVSGSFDLFVGHEVRAIEQTNGFIKFKATSLPTGDITVEVLVRN
jgi:hypothetical protein